MAGGQEGCGSRVLGRDVPPVEVRSSFSRDVFFEFSSKNAGFYAFLLQKTDCLTHTHKDNEVIARCTV